MSSESEAVMVSPEQCATAPRPGTKGATLAAAPKANPTRLVLLAVLALAAATGAMFGVVVFGNEFTKDVHANGGAHMNAVTLVDGQDRAIATADVESYVSLLDLPLLGTAELNKVDGITFSTYKGIEHHKVTGYTITKETIVVGNSVVETPRLSLRSEPGVTIEVSVRDAKAWISETGAIASRTEIDTAPQRRLAGGAGSCLANGACLYSREELLSVDAETRKLTEGGFFARADVAAYQVDLNGEDVMSHLSNEKAFSHFEGVYEDEDGSPMMLRARRSTDSTQVYLKNLTDGAARLMTVNGTFLFNAKHELDNCVMDVPSEALSALDFDELKENMAGLNFKEADISHGRKDIESFIPHMELGPDACSKFNKAKTNYKEFEFVKEDSTSGNANRKMMAKALKPMSHDEKYAAHAKEMLSYMNDPKNERNVQLKASKAEFVRRMKQQRRLQDMDMFMDTGGMDTGGMDTDTDSWDVEFDSMNNLGGIMTETEIRSITDLMEAVPVTSTFGVGPLADKKTYISHFDLWLCTRLADPTFRSEGLTWLQGKGAGENHFAQGILGVKLPSGASEESIIDGVDDKNAKGEVLSTMSALNLAGHSGVASDFQYWVGLLPAERSYLPAYVVSQVKAATDTDSDVWAPKKGVLKGMPAPERHTFDVAVSKSFFHLMFPGSCSGGYNVDWGTDWNPLLNLGRDAINQWSKDNKWFNGEDIMKEAHAFDGRLAMAFCERLQAGEAPEKNQIKDYTNTLELRDNYKVGKDGGIMRAPECSKDDNCIKEWKKMIDVLCEKAFDKDKKGAAPVYKIGAGEDFITLGFMNTWASYLYKDPDGKTKTGSGNKYEAEYVAAFQGTKGTDTTMVQYNLRNDAVFTYIGGLAVIIPVGYLDYVSGLMDCLDDFVDYYKIMDSQNNPGYTHLSYITGHSLGGAAATLFANSRTAPNGNCKDKIRDVQLDTKTMGTVDGTRDCWNPKGRKPGVSDVGMNIATAKFPRLVTFGASPTAYKGTGSKIEEPRSDGKGATTVNCRRPPSGQDGWNFIKHAPSQEKSKDWGYEFKNWCAKSDDKREYMTTDGYDEYVFSHGGASAFCSLAPPKSIRFAHKYDPIPSVAMKGFAYAHATTYAVLLMDKWDSTSCTTPQAGANDYCQTSGNKLKSGKNYGDLTKSGDAIMGITDDKERSTVSNPFLIKWWLCTKFNVAPVAYVTSCHEEYTSYFTLLNPAPCAVISVKPRLHEFLTGGSIINGVLDVQPSTGDFSIDKVTKAFFGENGKVCAWNMGTGGVFCMDIYSAADMMWTEFESLGDCLSDWSATTSAHFVASIADNPSFMGALFTFSWVHSTYAFYPLCMDDGNGKAMFYDTTGTFEELPASRFNGLDDTKYTHHSHYRSKCSGGQMAAIYAFCKRGNYLFSTNCVSAAVKNERTDPRDNSYRVCKPCCVKEFDEDIIRMGGSRMMGCGDDDTPSDISSNDGTGLCI